MTDVPSVTFKRRSRERTHSAMRERILDGTVTLLSERPAQRLTMREVANHVGIARATLYRYYRTVEELFAGVGDHRRARFKSDIRAAVEGLVDPIDIFLALLRFLRVYNDAQMTDRFLEAEPHSVLRNIRAYFRFYVECVEAEMAPVFDWIEAQIQRPLRRGLATEIVVRNQFSAALIPGDGDWANLDLFVPEVWTFLFGPAIKPQAAKRLAR